MMYVPPVCGCGQAMINKKCPTCDSPKLRKPAQRRLKEEATLREREYKANSPRSLVGRAIVERAEAAAIEKGLIEPAKNTYSYGAIWQALPLRTKPAKK